MRSGGTRTAESTAPGRPVCSMRDSEQDIYFGLLKTYIL